MLIKYYLKTYGEMLREKGSKHRHNVSQRKHSSKSQKCQLGHILNSAATTVAMKTLVLNSPLRGCFRKCSSFLIPALPETAPFQASAEQCSTNGTSTAPVMEETRAAWNGTSAVSDELLDSRRHFALMNTTHFIKFRSHHTEQAWPLVLVPGGGIVGLRGFLQSDLYE